MSEICYVLNFKRKKKTRIELIIQNKSEKSMKNEKKNLGKDQIFGRISNTKFLTKTFVVTGQTQSQNQP